MPHFLLRITPQTLPFKANTDLLLSYHVEGAWSFYILFVFKLCSPGCPAVLHDLATFASAKQAHTDPRATAQGQKKHASSPKYGAIHALQHRSSWWPFTNSETSTVGEDMGTTFSGQWTSYHPSHVFLCICKRL